jgi:tRNA(fMet)-specific endonuclease VapC
LILSHFLLDTDICSYVMKRSHPEVLGRLRALTSDQVCISVVTKAELLYGAEISPRREQDRVAVAAFLQQVEVLDFPDTAALHYAQIRADLKRKGTMIGANDLFLAAHACCLGLTLVTNNVREFGRISSLLLENWTQPA